MAYVIKHIKKDPAGGPDNVMYFKRFGKFNVEWVDDPKLAKQYKEEHLTQKDSKTLRQASKGEFYIERI